MQQKANCRYKSAVRFLDRQNQLSFLQPVPCDQCKIEERMFRIAKDFVDGIEYKFPFHERRVDFCVQNLINKFGPKSHKKYICLSIYMTEDWMSDHMFKIEDNGPEWFAE